MVLQKTCPCSGHVEYYLVRLRGKGSETPKPSKGLRWASTNELQNCKAQFCDATAQYRNTEAQQNRFGLRSSKTRLRASSPVSPKPNEREKAPRGQASEFWVEICEAQPRQVVTQFWNLSGWFIFLEAQLRVRFIAVGLHSFKAAPPRSTAASQRTGVETLKPGTF